jgi:hypothetical protein
VFSAPLEVAGIGDSGTPNSMDTRDGFSCPRPFFTLRVARDPGTIRSLRLSAYARDPLQVLG